MKEASRLWYDHPARQFHFFNRGISVNKVPDLAQRWQVDTLDIKPDLLSILVGINDTRGGIHPMPAGHELIARKWIGQVARRLKFIK